MTKWAKTNLSRRATDKQEWKRMVKDNFYIYNQNLLDKAMTAAAEDASDLLVQEAKDRCPVDTYSLEDAIVKKQRRGYGKGSQFYIIEVEDRPMYDDTSSYFMVKDEATGQWKRVHGEPRRRKEPRTTREYAQFVNANIEPYGEQSIGPKSQMKAAWTGKVVGGGFIERAILDNQEAVNDIIRDIMEETFTRL